MKILWITIGLILIISGCTGQKPVVFDSEPGSLVHDLPKVELLESGEFAALIEDEGVFLLNVHTPYEGEISGTDAVIEDWENIGLHTDQLPEDKNKPIAVYCRSGRMSADAAEQLIDLGYTKVYDLKNGMIGWKESGRDIVEK